MQKSFIFGGLDLEILYDGRERKGVSAGSRYDPVSIIQQNVFISKRIDENGAVFSNTSKSV